MKDQFRLSMFCLFLLLTPAMLNASRYLDLSLGQTLNLESQVEVSQQHYEDINFTTGFTSKGFQSPMYYSIRIGWIEPSCDYEFEIIHNKLYASQLPEDIQHFEISHGLNSIFANRVCLISDMLPKKLRHKIFQLRMGLGGALANPYTIIRNQRWYENGGITVPILNESGYHFTAPFAQIGIQHVMSNRILIETKWVAGRVDIPVTKGKAVFWHRSFHFLLGLSIGR